MDGTGPDMLLPQPSGPRGDSRTDSGAEASDGSLDARGGVLARRSRRAARAGSRRMPARRFMVWSRSRRRRGSGSSRGWRPARGARGRDPAAACSPRSADEATRRAGPDRPGRARCECRPGPQAERSEPCRAEPAGRGLDLCAGRSARRRAGARPGCEPAPTRLVHCLVTAVDGAGRDRSWSRPALDGQRSTAVFLCDAGEGIIDAVGQIEGGISRGRRTGREVQAQAGGRGVEGAPELALGLLAGSLMLNERRSASRGAGVARATLGPDFRPRPLPAPRPTGPAGRRASADAAHLRTGGARRLPSLAGPLAAHARAGRGDLSSGRVGSQPDPLTGFRGLPVPLRAPHHPPAGAVPQDAPVDGLVLGAWRRARSGQVGRSLAGQLSDEQYAVPSHPFAVALMARSLEAAQARLETERPIPGRREKRLTTDS